MRGKADERASDKMGGKKTRCWLSEDVRDKSLLSFKRSTKRKSECPTDEVG